MQHTSTGGLVSVARPSETISIAPAISRLPATTSAVVRQGTVQSGHGQVSGASLIAARMPMTAPGTVSQGFLTQQVTTSMPGGGGGTRPTLRVIIPNSRTSDEVMCFQSVKVAFYFICSFNFFGLKQLLVN